MVPGAVTFVTAVHAGMAESLIDRALGKHDRQSQCLPGLMGVNTQLRVGILLGIKGIDSVKPL